MKVFVYFNLHKKLWSIKALEGERKGKVIGHQHNVVLKRCTFKVSEAGRQRVLREKKKNVHAGIVGHFDVFATQPTGLAIPIVYNPYKFKTFVVNTDWNGMGEWVEVHYADQVSMVANDISGAQVHGFDIVTDLSMWLNKKNDKVAT